MRVNASSWISTGGDCADNLQYLAMNCASNLYKADERPTGAELALRISLFEGRSDLRVGEMLEDIRLV